MMLWWLLLIKGLRLVNTFKLLNVIRRSFIKRHQILLLLSLIPLIKLILHFVGLKNLSETLLLELCELIFIIIIMVCEHWLVVGLFFVITCDFCNCPTRLTVTRIIFHFLISSELLLVVCRLKSGQLVRVLYILGHENQLVVDFLCNSLWSCRFFGTFVIPKMSSWSFKASICRVLMLRKRDLVLHIIVLLWV